MRAQTFSYRDALILLGAGDSTAIAVLGRLTGVAASTVSVATLGAMDFFAVRDELVAWGNRTARGLRERMTGIGRFDRTQRLVAAHSVLVITAFYEALGEVLDAEGAIDLRAVRLTREEQVSLSTGRSAGSHYHELVSCLVSVAPPMPTSHRPYEHNLALLGAYYFGAANKFVTFLHGLAEFERQADGLDALTVLLDDLVVAATRRYEIAYRSLATEVPEFAMWAGIVDAQATRATIERVGDELHQEVTGLTVGLAGIEEALNRIAVGIAPDARRADLAKRYRAALGQPILNPRDLPAHVVLPTLGAAYVNPRCRAAVVGRADQVATASWWKDKPIVTDIQAFLTGHLTGPDAVLAPLVVLGQPGSGKSVLTRVLVARLPATDFLAVRVELRAVPADAAVQDQIEEALYQALGDRVAWPDLARSAGGALPVVILDGFDEMLQATGLNRSDYLDRVREFQLREVELDRPVAVVVTSRTVVADRARFPDGCVAIQLEPFEEEQIGEWLGVWNDANAASLTARGLDTLPMSVVLTHGDLASQPLLLLLLALYDTGENALQKVSGGLGRVELYDRIFLDFAEREVDKHHQDLPTPQRRAAVDGELRRLSAVALAMFNRGGDVISEAHLDQDVGHLLTLEDLTEPTTRATVSRALTIGQLLVGRFFFIHESQATRDTGPAEKTFEFLHATFGEFLTARLVVGALVDLADERLHQAARRRPGVLDAGYLHAATSFSTITGRAPVRDFCHGLLVRLTSPQRQACRDLLMELLADAGFPHPTWSFADYQPYRSTVVARQATFTANLVTLLVLLADEPLPVGEAMGRPAEEQWRRHALLWQSQLPAGDWAGLWQSFRVWWQPHGTCPRPDCDRPLRRLVVAVEDQSPVSAEALLPWPSGAADHEKFQGSDTLPVTDVVTTADGDFGRFLREAAFAQLDSTARELVHHMAPAMRHAAVGWWYSDGHTSATRMRLLMELLFQPAGASALLSQRRELYELVLIEKPMALDVGPERRISHLAYQQLREDAANLPVEDAVKLVPVAQGRDAIEESALVVADLVRRGVDVSVFAEFTTMAKREHLSTIVDDAFSQLGLPSPYLAQQRAGQ
jgi:hypothetical protein